VTLLEALVALVIMGLAAVGFLDAFQGASRSARDAEAWAQAVSHAEAGMELTVLGVDARADSLPGLGRRIEARAWRGDVDEVTVTVTMPRGGRYVLRRLVRRPMVTVDATR
jgi:type II secretory pathway pseudopilin PulG